jgi:hypothetical protein
MTANQNPWPEDSGAGTSISVPAGKNISQDLVLKKNPDWPINIISGNINPPHPDPLPQGAREVKGDPLP